MQEYEVVCKYLNGCAGAAHPITTFEEVELSDPDEYIKSKHGAAFRQFTKEVTPEGKTLYTYCCGVTYIYEFTPL